MIDHLPYGCDWYPVDIHTDKRGSSFEMHRADNPEDTNIRMGYLSWTLPGESRGPHEHTEQTDLFIFAGPGMFELRLWDIRHQPKKISVELAKELQRSYIIGNENPVKLKIMPGIVHGYKNISSVPGLVLNFPDELYRGWKKNAFADERKWELEKDNPFSMQ